MPTLINNSTQKALTTLARAKVFLGIASDKHDSLLTQLINQITGFIENYIQRSLLSQTYTEEEYDGTGIDTLILKNFPVTTFNQLQVNQAADNTDNWDTINSTRYQFYSDGRLMFVKGSTQFLATDAGFFIEALKKYRVTYVAGYKIDFAQENDPANHTLPQDIEYVCHKLVAGAFNSGKSSGIEMNKVGDVSVKFKSNLFADKELKEMLDKYAAHRI